MEPQDAGSNPGGAAGAVTFQIYSPTAPVICIITILLYNTNVEVVSWYLLSSPKPEMQGSIPCFHFFFNTTIFFPITYAYCGKIGLTPNSNFFQSLFLFNHICMYHGRIGSRIGLSRMLKFGLRLLISFSCVLTRLPHKHQIREAKTWIENEKYQNI